MIRYCELCGAVHDGLYGSGRFCSQKCSRSYSSRIHRNETNKKISKSLRSKPKRIKPLKYGYCVVCGKKYIKKYVRTTCSDECYRKVLSKTTKRGLELGKIKPFLSRKITSYSERFWIKVLENNSILFEREKHVGKYFLDFHIKIGLVSIDLEIDGKQHNCPDRVRSDIERDLYLRNKNFYVYRIPWNQINTDLGKDLMKQKIHKFLEFIDDVKNISI